MTTDFKGRMKEFVVSNLVCCTEMYMLSLSLYCLRLSSLIGNELVPSCMRFCLSHGIGKKKRPQ